MSLARVVLHILISFILGFMALCLKSSQKHFLDTKGSDLWSAICEGDAHRVPPPCHIKLATSEVDQECLLLILDGNTGQELSPSHHHASGPREGLGGGLCRAPILTCSLGGALSSGVLLQPWRCTWRGEGVHGSWAPHADVNCSVTLIVMHFSCLTIADPATDVLRKSHWEKVNAWRGWALGMGWQLSVRMVSMPGVRCCARQQ